MVEPATIIATLAAIGAAIYAYLQRRAKNVDAHEREILFCDAIDALADGRITPEEAKETAKKTYKFSKD